MKNINRDVLVSINHTVFMMHSLQQTEKEEPKRRVYTATEVFYVTTFQLQLHYLLCGNDLRNLSHILNGGK